MHLALYLVKNLNTKEETKKWFSVQHLHLSNDIIVDSVVFDDEFDVSLYHSYTCLVFHENFDKAYLQSWL